MKKIISILLIAITVLSMAACQTSDPASTPANPSEAAPTTTAGNKEPKTLVLSETYTKITSNVQMQEMFRMEEDMLLDYYGIKAEHYKQVEIYMCADSLLADEIWLIEAANADALEQLKQLAQFRLTTKDEESVTYSPEQNAVIKKAHLATYGNYLVMIVSPNVDALAAAFKAEAGV